MIDAFFDRAGRNVARLTALLFIFCVGLLATFATSAEAWQGLEPWLLLAVCGATLVGAPLATALGVVHALYVSTMSEKRKRRRLAWLEVNAPLAWPRLVLAVGAIYWPPLALLWVAAEGAPVTLAVLRLAHGGEAHGGASDDDDSEAAALALGAPTRLAAMIALWLRLRPRVGELLACVVAQMLGALCVMPLVLHLFDDQPHLSSTTLPYAYLVFALAGVLIPRVLARQLVREVGW